MQSEVAELSEELDKVREKYNFEVAIYTESDMTSASAQASADDIYDYNGYGTGENDDGIMLYICSDIMEEIKVCFATNDREKENYLKYAENAIHHFDYIFGVNDGQKGLFSFGMSTKEKRDLKAAVAFTKTAFDAVKVAKNGGEMSEEKKSEIMENMNAIDDAQTGGLAKYTRAADAAEAKIN